MIYNKNTPSTKQRQLSVGILIPEYKAIPPELHMQLGRNSLVLRVRGCSPFIRKLTVVLKSSVPVVQRINCIGFVSIRPKQLH